MKHSSVTCDWCEATMEARYVGYVVRHIGAFATFDGERFDFDFCDFACLEEWRRHGGRSKRTVERLAEREALGAPSFSDRDA